MGFRRRLEQREALASSKTSFWEDMLSRISRGSVIPVISSSLSLEPIFREANESTSEEGEQSIQEQLTSAWADAIGYPMRDKYNLARVAQYHLEESASFVARAKYFQFLKSLLLDIYGEEEVYRDVVQKLRNQIHELSFSQIACELDFPRFPENTEGALRLLARLPLPIYITTSQSDFMERALQAEGKQPKTHICFWLRTIYDIKPEYRPDPQFVPTAVQPAVYHLYGLEEYPQSLIMSEDDYMNVLVALGKDTDTVDPIVPLQLRQALYESSLVLLGYQEFGWNWESRVLNRLILEFRSGSDAPRSLVIPLYWMRGHDQQEEKILQYLSKYFDRRNFGIQWESAESFVQQLWQKWVQYKTDQ